MGPSTFAANLLAPPLACLLVVLALATPEVARADPHPEAAAHFARGERAYDEQRFADAAVELEAAYRLAPDWRLLFSLGNVYAALGRPVEAVQAFGRYLQGGGDAIDAEQRAHVQRKLDYQEAKVGTLELVVSEPGALVLVDNQPVGTGPMSKPWRVAAGTHVVVAELHGYHTARAQLEVPAQGTARFSPSLVALATPEQPASRARVRVPGRGQRIAGYVIAAGGLTLISVGAWSVLDGVDKHDDAVKRVRGKPADDPAWVPARQLESDAEGAKKLGRNLLLSGGASLVLGVVLLATAPRYVALASAPVVPWATATSAGLILRREL